MSDLKAKMQQNWFLLGLCHTPRWGPPKWLIRPWMYCLSITVCGESLNNRVRNKTVFKASLKFTYNVTVIVVDWSNYDHIETYQSVKLNAIFPTINKHIQPPSLWTKLVEAVTLGPDLAIGMLGSCPRDFITGANILYEQIVRKKEIVRKLQ